MPAATHQTSRDEHFPRDVKSMLASPSPELQMAHAFTWQCTFTCFYHCLGRSLPVPTSLTSGQDLPPNKPIFTFKILTVTWEATSCCAWLNYFGGPTGLFFFIPSWALKNGMDTFSIFYIFEFKTNICVIGGNWQGRKMWHSERGLVVLALS